VKADKDIKPENIPVITSVLEKELSFLLQYLALLLLKRKGKKARLNTSPHMVTVLEGQTIVFEGEFISDTDILMLTRLGLLQTGFNWKRLLYIFFIIFCSPGTIWYFIFTNLI